MNKANIPSGTWPVMLTPFKTDGTVDYEAFEKLIEFYLNAGVVGLFACCGSGEILELTVDEMVNISANVIKLVDGRVPVVSGAILHDQMPAQIEFAKRVADTGPEAVVLSPNQFVREGQSDEELLAKLKEITGVLDDIPLGIYEYPMPYKILISDHILKWLISTERYVFFKDTCCDIDIIKRRLSIIRTSNMAHFNAHLPTFLESLQYGCNGYCGTAANFCPELYRWLSENFEKKPRVAELVAQTALKFNKITDLCDNYPANAKTYLNMIGVSMENYCRRDVPEITDEHKKILRGFASELDDFLTSTLYKEECIA